MINSMNILSEYTPSVYNKCRTQELRCHQDVMVVKDVTDGLLYKNLSIEVHRGNNANVNTHVVMLMLNTDGAPVFKSQHYSFWPLYASVLEIPRQKRLV